MSRPAPTAARVRAQATFDTLTFLRNGEQTLVSIVLPALALVGGVLAPWPDLGPGRRADVVVPGVLALAVLSSPPLDPTRIGQTSARLGQSFSGGRPSSSVRNAQAYSTASFLK